MNRTLAAADVSALSGVDFSTPTAGLAGAAAILGFGLLAILVIAFQTRSMGPEKYSFEVIRQGKVDRAFTSLGAAQSYVDKKLSDASEGETQSNGLIVPRSSSPSLRSTWHKPTEADAWGVYGDWRKGEYSIVQMPRKVPHLKRLMIFLIIVAAIAVLLRWRGLI